MLDDHTGAGFLRQAHVSGHQIDFRLAVGSADSVKGAGFSSVNSIIFDKCRVFLVEADGNAQSGGLFHGPARGFLCKQGDSVIGKAHSARRQERRHVSQLLPLHSPGHIGAGGYMDCRLLSFFQNPGKGFRVVHAWIRVGHENHGGNASRRRSAGSRPDIFLMFKARFPEMDMGIHKSRRGNHASGIYDLKHVRLPTGKNSSLFFRDRVCYFYDFIILNQNVFPGVSA